MKFLLREITKPILRRVGTAIAAYLAAQSIDANTIELIVNGLSATALVAWDLGWSHFERRKGKA